MDNLEKLLRELDGSEVKLIIGQDSFVIEYRNIQYFFETEVTVYDALRAIITMDESCYKVRPVGNSPCPGIYPTKND